MVTEVKKVLNEMEIYEAFEQLPKIILKKTALMAFWNFEPGKNFSTRVSWHYSVLFHLFLLFTFFHLSIFIVYIW